MAPNKEDVHLVEGDGRSRRVKREMRVRLRAFGRMTECDAFVPFSFCGAVSGMVCRSEVDWFVVVRRFDLSVVVQSFPKVKQSRRYSACNVGAGPAEAHHRCPDAPRA